MHTVQENHSNVLIRKLIHASDLSGPSLGSEELYEYKTNKRLFYTTVHSMMIGQQGPKHAADCCGSNLMCVYVGRSVTIES